MIRALTRRIPFWLAATLALTFGGPWVVGAILWYWMTILRAFGVELAPAR